MSQRSDHLLRSKGVRIVLVNLNDMVRFQGEQSIALTFIALRGGRNRSQKARS